MTRNFELEFNDLTWEKQQEMIEALKEDWIEALKSEAISECARNAEFWAKWKIEHKCTDKQLHLVALNELYDFEDINEETEWNEEFYKSLQYDMENFAEKKAEEACWAGVHNMEIEVETP